ncbi:DUF4276 family protein, partial [Arthrospira platensis SPKY1]|nr:DUF4276 family protein [Arthrospira platensis SPKY1]
RASVSSPEEINDHPQTAPSKRLISLLKGYDKALHGPLVALDIGLDRLRVENPRFDAWIKRLEALATT